MSVFRRLQELNQGAFVPFVVLGDPNPDDSLRIIQCLIDAGADALELGIPFSDPLADGPTIQAAMVRALDGGVSPGDCFDIIRRLRSSNSQIPIGLLVYANIVNAFGIADFYRQCQIDEVDSVLVADVPVRESAPFRDAASAHGVCPIYLCPPNIDPPTLEKVAKLGDGYTYLLSRPGVTGTSVAAGRPVHELLEQLREQNAPPTLLGFGISQPDHVIESIDAGAAGVIVGSAIIERIESHLPDVDQVSEALQKFCTEMKAATQR